MKNITSTFTLIAAITLVVLAWSDCAFAGEIQDAAENGNLEKITALLKDHPDLISSKDGFGDTPLLTAALYGKKDAVVLLLADKADVNATNIVGRTPLHLAAIMNHKDVVEVLLANKADVNAKDNSGQTPLDWAVSKNRKEIVELLRKAAATNKQ